MNLIRFLLRSGRSGIVVVALAGLISGFASSLFVAMVNAALHRKELTWLAVAFIGVVIARISANLLSQWFLARFAQGAVLDLCERLSRQIARTPFRALERIGPARIMSTLTDDVVGLSGALQAIPPVITNGAILFGCVIYLAWLSTKAALTLTALGAVGAIGYRLLMRRAIVAVSQARAERDTFFRNLRALTEGIKELQMNQARRQVFLDQGIVQSSVRMRTLNLTAIQQYLLGDGWAQLMFFLIIGLMLFVLPRLERISVDALTGYAFVALYAMTPIWGFINALPLFHRGQAALDRITNLGLHLAADEAAETAPSTREARPVRGPALELKGVSFAYEAAEDGTPGFALGPIDLTLHAGELVFLIGGNGSGKSTFVKLLTGLYPPESGQIMLDGHAIAPADLATYREQFSVVFSDFYLFDTLAGLGGEDLDSRAQEYLRLLDLSHKVQVTRGVFSTTALSQGQRRRLALLGAYLEDRPIYVFDEWAADQDPNYRQIFYSRLLPELKARGKTVVVITHDERYFHLGDRVIKLDYGRIVDSWSPGETGAPQIPVVPAVQSL